MMKDHLPTVEVIPGLFVPRMAVRWSRCPVCRLADMKPLLYRQLNLLLVQGRTQTEVVRAAHDERVELKPYSISRHARHVRELIQQAKDEMGLQAEIALALEGADPGETMQIILTLVGRKVLTQLHREFTRNQAALDGESLLRLISLGLAATRSYTRLQNMLRRSPPARDCAPKGEEHDITLLEFARSLSEDHLPIIAQYLRDESAQQLPGMRGPDAGGPDHDGAGPAAGSDCRRAESAAENAVDATD